MCHLEGVRVVLPRSKASIRPVCVHWNWTSSSWGCQGGDLSTGRVIQAFTLNNTDPSFVKVRAVVDKAMAKSVIQIYGEFSELTTPILTQVSYVCIDLSTLSDIITYPLLQSHVA